MLQQLSALISQQARPRSPAVEVDWSGLDERCWVLVFEHLTNQQRAVARLACQRFRKLGVLTHGEAQQVPSLDYQDAARMAFLAQLPHLRQLSVDSAETLLHLQPLTQLTSLHIYTSLSHLDFAPLTNLVRLQSLSLERCKVDNVRPLSELTMLTSIELYRCDLSNLQALSTLTGLQIARLHANPKITDISPLSTLLNLTRLQLSQAGVMSVQPLTTLTGLECLFLDRAQLTPNLQHFAHFSRLQHLALTTNGTLVDVTPLASLQKIYCLDLLDCKLSNIEALTSLTGLRRLGLRKSRIADVAALTKLSTLTALDIRRTNFTDVDELGQLPELRLLVLPEGGPHGGRAMSPPAHTRQPLTILRDDGGYLGCSFKHANLKHMTDRHALRVQGHTIGLGRADTEELADGYQTANT